MMDSMSSEKSLFVKTYSRKCPVRVWRDEKIVTTVLQTKTPAPGIRPYLKRHRIYPEAWPKPLSNDERFISLSQRKSSVRLLKNISNVKDIEALRVAGKRLGSPFHKNRKGSPVSISRGFLELIEESESKDLTDCKLGDASSHSENVSVQYSDILQLSPWTTTPAVSECSSSDLLEDDTSRLSESSSATDSMETIADDCISDIDTSSTLSAPDEYHSAIETTEDTTLCPTNSTMTTATTAFAEEEETFPDLEILRRDLPASEEIARPVEPVQFSFLNKLKPKSFGRRSKGLPFIKVSKVTPKKRPSVGKFTGSNRANSTLQKEMGLGINDYESAGDLSNIPVDKNLEGHWNVCADRNLNSTPIENSGISLATNPPDVSSIPGIIKHIDMAQEVTSSMDMSSICVAQSEALHTGQAKRQPRSVYSFTSNEDTLESTNSLQIHGQRLLTQAKADNGSAINKQSVQFATPKSVISSSNSSKQVSFSLSANKKKEYQPELSIRSAQLHLPTISPNSILKKLGNGVSLTDRAVEKECINKRTSTPIRRKRRGGRIDMMEYSFDVSAVGLPACDESELIIQDSNINLTTTDVQEEIVTPNKSNSIKQAHKPSCGNSIDKDLQNLMIRGEMTPSMRIKRSSSTVAPNLPKNKKSRKLLCLNDFVEHRSSGTQTVKRKQLQFRNQAVGPSMCCLENFNQYSRLPGKVIQYKSSVNYDQNIPEDILTILPGTVNG
ncbi:uncharacterized protein LOC117121941 isoform X2 [Anneissia japonica]|uniref:uncharacterized protein LOC117121941 isoform X2 n=1 Tax=Anneissia japonica TaxID=1529436 RepID=UPI001425B784|nr:uncharacterized protein LOC117121941 isoform X2 [Anneissia japonica]